MPNTIPSKPFKPDTTAIDAVQQAVLAARQQYEQLKKDSRAEWEAEAIASFERHEAKRRDAVITQWKYDNEFQRPRYKYEGWQPAEIYRDSLTYEERIPKLLEAGQYDQALRCFLVRNNADATATISEVKRFLAPYLPVDGDYHIEPLADGLSQELYKLLSGRMFELNVGRITFDWRHDHCERASW